MNLLDTFFGRRRKAADTIREIAQREARGKAKDSDGEQLADALAAAGKTENDYEAIVAIFKRADELRAAAKKADAAEKAALKAIEARDQHARETAEIIKKRHEESRKLAASAMAHQGELERAQRAAAELDDLVDEHVDLFPGERADYDAFTLIGRGAVITHSDDAAPVKHVTDRIFDRESERRSKAIAAARARARAEHDAAMQRWLDGGELNVYGQRAPTTPPPEFSLPGWADVAAA